MTILVATDSFKESMHSFEASKAIARGIQELDSSIHIETLPISDGGEGSIDILEELSLGEVVSRSTVDAHHREIEAKFLLFKDKSTCWIELSQASGLWRINPTERDPNVGSTYGTGLLVNYALELGCTKIILSVGGSATHDLGFGIAEALGVEFFNSDDQNVRITGGTLGTVTRVSIRNLDPRIQQKKASLTILYDVTNPLLGPNGASKMYLSQKGANEETVEIFEKRTQRLVSVLKNVSDEAKDSAEGMGASGGVPYGLQVLMGAECQPAFDYFDELLEYERAVQSNDIILTGEGSIDKQTIHGKGPGRILQYAHRYQKPSIVFAGLIKDRELLEAHFPKTTFVSISPPAMDLIESIKRGPSLLQSATKKVLSTYIPKHGT